MNLYQHFACYTKVPIRLRDVRDHLLDQKVVASISYVPVPSMEPAFLRGFVRRKRNRVTRDIHAFVFFSTKLSSEWQRVVICKELTHLTNNHPATAGTRAEVSELIKELVPNAEVKSAPGVIDILGILHGLCILFPRDAANILRAKHAAGQITSEKIAKDTRLPPEILPLLLLPEWRAILESID